MSFYHFHCYFLFKLVLRPFFSDCDWKITQFASTVCLHLDLNPDEGHRYGRFN